MIEALWEWNLWFWQTEAFALIVVGIVGLLWVLLNLMVDGTVPPIGFRPRNVRLAEEVLLTTAQAELDKLRKGMAMVLPEGASVVYPADGSKPRIVMRPTSKTGWQ